MARLGRSYTIPIIRRGADGSTPFVPVGPPATIVTSHRPSTLSRVILRSAPLEQEVVEETTTTTSAVVVSATKVQQRKSAVFIATAPALLKFGTIAIVPSFPSVEKRYKQFVVNQPTDSEEVVTTYTAKAVVVTHRRFPPKVKVWTWQGSPDAEPPEVGAGPPHICPPTFAPGPERDTGTGGSSRITGGGGSGRITGGGSATRTTGPSTQTRLSSISTSTRTTTVIGPSYTTSTEDGC